MKQTFCQRGMTLVEILVVLGLLAVVSAVAASGLGMRGPDMERTGDRLSTALQSARAQALQGGRSARLVVDLDARRYRVDPNGPEGQLPERFEVALEIADRERIGSRAGGIRFYTDGSSSGGTVELADPAKGESLHIEVDWMTGLISTRAGDPAR